ncbi:hypothetical protein GF345_04985 [Candidatus Woesearchaeota archaeon]|nr:hypothetical protein [Candidatus Woesearchaeota archaeon]
MKKGLTGFFAGIIMMILISTIACAVPGYDLQLSTFRFGGVYDDQLEMHYNVYNSGLENIEDATVTLWIPDAGYYAASGGFDISDGEKHGHYFTPGLDSLEPGWHFARIMVSSDYSRDIMWRWIEIE